MGIERDEDIEYEEKECVSCFLKTTCDLEALRCPPYKCEFCANKDMDEREVLERRLSIMNKTNAYRISEILRQMYRVLSEKK